MKDLNKKTTEELQKLLKILYRRTPHKEWAINLILTELVKRGVIQ